MSVGREQVSSGKLRSAAKFTARRTLPGDRGL